MKFVPVVAVVAAALVALPGPGSAARRPGATPCRAGVLHPVGTATMAYAALARRSGVDAYKKPRGRRLAHFKRLNVNGYRTTFSIVGAIINRSCRASWYRVALPMRPNGVKGYVRPKDVLVQKVRTRIEIDLSERRLSFFAGRRLVLKTPVAVGSPATPTPVGRFYVDQRILTTNPNGPYGPGALGVAAFSDVLTGWSQGGPIGIHGTNAPWSIGRAVSNGCIRVPNATLKKLFAATVGGEPVLIHR